MQRLAVDATDQTSVSTYEELLAAVAALAWENRNLQLQFRGQSDDFPTHPGGTAGGCLYPSIFRNDANRKGPHAVDARYQVLDQASDALVNSLRAGSEDEQQLGRMVARDRLLQWAVIQHYEICDTPLLDVTPSLPHALGFADPGDRPHLYVLGMPPQTSALTIDLVEGIVSIDLAKFCPPVFKRPHFQAGYLVGEYPIVDNYESRRTASKDSRANYDFRYRLLAKFDLAGFDYESAPIPRAAALLPPDDAFLEIAETAKRDLPEWQPIFDASSEKPAAGE